MNTDLRIQLAPTKGFSVTPQRRVALIGNGLSIAASDGFRMPALTAAMRAALENLDGGALVHRLDEVGAILASDSTDFHPTDDFEDLLGPLDRVAALLRGPLGQIIGAGPHQNVLYGAARTVGTIYVRGVGAVLGVVDGQAVDEAPIQTVVDWMLGGLSADDILSVYTLNYDPLLDHWLLEADNDGARPEVELDDEFVPFGHQQVPLVQPGEWLELYPLRGPAHPRPNNVHLYHLHGAMHWVEYAGSIWKAQTIEDLRAHDVFDRWAAGEALPIAPHVVLTDQKARRVEVEPFKSGYEALLADLEHADRVVVAGYGFGDIPVNTSLAHGWHHRKPKSRWLIVERGDLISRVAKLRRIASVMQFPGPMREPRVSWAGLPGVAIDQSTFWF